MSTVKCPFQYPDCTKCAIQTTCGFNKKAVLPPTATPIPGSVLPSPVPDPAVDQAEPETKTEPEVELKDPFEDFDTSLFSAQPKVEFADHVETEEEIDRNTSLCSYYPTACNKVSTSRCDKTCERHPDKYITDPKVRDVFEQEPWSNYCFTCGEFVPSRRHEDALDPPGLVYSHVVATGYTEFRAKLREWVMKRITGKDGE